MLRRLTYTTLAAFVLIACKPADEDPDKPATPIAEDDAATVLAEQICAQLFSCECEASAAYTDQAECIAQYESAISEVMDPILANGGTWNAECAGNLSKAISQWSCLGPTLANNATSWDFRSCPVLKGTKALGAECYNDVFGDECADGLACIDSTCIEQPVLPVPAGGICEISWDQLPCESGTWCSYQPNSDYRVCVPMPALGDPCNPNEDYLCGPSSNDLICDYVSATCIAAPGEGEPCFDSFLCGPGTYCDGGKDFTCQPRRELGQGCGADSVCPVDASCINNICQADASLVCNVPNWFF